MGVVNFYLMYTYMYISLCMYVMWIWGRPTSKSFLVISISFISTISKLNLFSNIYKNYLFYNFMCHPIRVWENDVFIHPNAWLLLFSIVCNPNNSGITMMKVCWLTNGAKGKNDLISGNSSRWVKFEKKCTGSTLTLHTNPQT